MRDISLEELAGVFNNGMLTEGHPRIEIFNLFLKLNQEKIHIPPGIARLSYNGDVTITASSLKYTTNGFQTFKIVGHLGDFNYYFTKANKDCEHYSTRLTIPLIDENTKLHMIMDQNSRIIY